MFEADFVVERKWHEWTIRFAGAEFRQFSDKQDAIETAVRWARAARKIGYPSSVLVKQGDRVEVHLANGAAPPEGSNEMP
jgi:hypothetical protein